MVSLFKYWNDGIKQGMRYGSELYTHAQSYSASERLKAYDAAYGHIAQGSTVCITVSKTHYSLWLCLRSRNGSNENN
ncbi:MAG: hypothetical protein ACAF41_07160 [Leptolyngbya sp. BL-A-14]